MSFIVSLLLFFCLSTNIALAQPRSGDSAPKTLSQNTGSAPPAAQASSKTHEPLWRQRRAEFWKTVKGVKAQDATSMKDFDAILTQYETKPFSRTPMENMDILGVFYAQKDEPEKVLIIVSANAALGWYDALRFGSESGRSEIVYNEKFFSRAFLLSGAMTNSKFMELIASHQDLARKSVLQGLIFAEKEKQNPHYDVRWPTAYGLERLICAEGGECNSPKEMPTDQWDKAWEEAKRRVTVDYTSLPSSSSTEKSPSSNEKRE